MMRYDAAVLSRLDDIHSYNAVRNKQVVILYAAYVVEMYKRKHTIVQSVYIWEFLLVNVKTYMKQSTQQYTTESC